MSSRSRRHRREHEGPSTKFVVRNETDIHRLSVRLLTSLSVPPVDVKVTKLPAIDSQRAQNRYQSLALKCNCLFGEMLGGTTLLAGAYWSWTTDDGWHNLKRAAVAAAVVGVTGKLIDLLWTRVRMLSAVWDLKTRLGRSKDETLESASGIEHRRTVEDPVTSARDSDKLSYERAALITATRRRRRLKFTLRSADDINRAMLTLLTSWSMPRIEIDIPTLPPRTTQFAQHSYSRWSEGNRYVAAAVLGTIGLLVGLAWVILPSDEPVLWTIHPNGSDVLKALAATAGSSTLGWLLEALWRRGRSLLLLARIRAVMR